MKTFLICPVRGHDKRETENIVKRLEDGGYIVYWPHRDTDQEDETGYRICCQNRDAIESADVIHIIWDGKSEGVLFDLGMAFAMGKKVVPLEMPLQTPGKSFQNMVSEWSQRCFTSEGHLNLS
jgi:nucleoside 2-deoxyribosyltransferase